MKILAVSDEECAALWDGYVPGRLSGYDMIISCGDLQSDYLTFLVTMSNVPLLYIHGNHDTSYAENPPEGCDCVDDHLIVYNGVRILGLGGCRWYHPGEHQVTEAQMRKRIGKLKKALRKAGGVDIVVTHAPPYGVGDEEDNAHIGFEAFLPLLEKYRPQYLLHGHVHLRYTGGTASQPIRERTYEDTSVVNVYQRHTLEVPEGQFKEKHRGQLRWITKHKE